MGNNYIIESLIMRIIFLPIPKMIKKTNQSFLDGSIKL